MALFKSKHEKVLEYIRDDYVVSMRIVWEQLPGLRQTHGVTDFRLEMAQHHKSAVNNACRRALRDKRMSPEPEVLSEGYWELTCAMFGLGDPSVAPNPWDQRPAPKPQAPLTEPQRITYQVAYAAAFDEWMLPRIKSGSDSPEDFARGEFFAHSRASAALIGGETEPQLDEIDDLRRHLYAANVERLGYTDKLPNPLPTMGV